MDQMQKEQLKIAVQNHADKVRSAHSSEVSAVNDDIYRLEQIVKSAVKGSHDEENTDIEKVLIYDKKTGSKSSTPTKNAPMSITTSSTSPSPAR